MSLSRPCKASKNKTSRVAKNFAKFIKGKLQIGAKFWPKNTADKLIKLNAEATLCMFNQKTNMTRKWNKRCANSIICLYDTIMVWQCFNQWKLGPNKYILTEYWKHYLTFTTTYDFSRANVSTCTASVACTFIRAVLREFSVEC